MTSALLFTMILAQPADAAVRGGAAASSVKVSEDRVRHTATLAMDGLLKTSWGEGVEGSGENSWLEVNLGRTRDLTEISIWPGNLSEGAKSFREYARPRNIKISLRGGRGRDVERVAVADARDRLHGRAQVRSRRAQPQDASVVPA